MTKNKKLADACYTCQSEEVFEVEVTFKEKQQLTLSICPICRMLNDWELPKEVRDENGEIIDEELANETYEWAETQAKRILLGKELWHLIKFSRNAEANLENHKEALIEKLKELANILDMQNIYVGIRRQRRQYIDLLKICMHAENLSAQDSGAPELA